MRGIPVLSLGVNKQTIRGSQLAYRHRSDGGKERGMEVQTGGNEMRQGVFDGRKRWRFFLQVETMFWDVRQRRYPQCFG